MKDRFSTSFRPSELIAAHLEVPERISHIPATVWFSMPLKSPIAGMTIALVLSPKMAKMVASGESLGEIKDMVNGLAKWDSTRQVAVMAGDAYIPSTLLAEHRAMRDLVTIVPESVWYSDKTTGEVKAAYLPDDQNWAYPEALAWAKANIVTA